MIRLVVPAGQARPGTPLSPALGQHGLKVADFVTEFNRATAGWTPGTPVGARVTKLPANKFTLRTAPPAVALLLRGGHRGGRVGRTHLWDVLRLRGVTTPAGAATLLGSLRSTRWVPA